MRSRRGQSWSMDLVIAVVVFGFIAVVTYSLLLIEQAPSIDELRLRSQTIQERLADGKLEDCNAILANRVPLRITENQTITQAELECLYDKTPEEIRTALNIQGKFCIYVEDAEGTVLLVKDLDAAAIFYRVAVGDPELTVANTACSAYLP